MPTLQTLGVFALATLAIIAVPGPSMLYILARGIANGRRVAIATALGVESASLLFVAATAVGLGAALAASGLALNAIRWAGVAYLLWLAVRALRRGAAAADALAAAPVRPRHAYREGLLVGLSNPKVILFFLALFPQFVDPARGPAATQVLILGGVFVALGLAADLTNAVVADRLGGWLRRHPAVQRRRHLAEAASYLGLGGAAAISGSQPSR